MENHPIKPDKITKPIQLLGAWLVGLLAVDSAFLIAATNMDLESWQSGALTIAAIVNVPIFIGALFLLQTRFRPELQEDTYYSSYLNNKTNQIMKVSKADVLAEQLSARIYKLESKLELKAQDSETFELSNLSYGVNVHLDKILESRIDEKLDDLNVGPIRVFGFENTAPSHLVVAIAEHIPKQLQKRILEMAKDIGFENYAYIEAFEEIEEDVLFGAYGRPEGKIKVSSGK